MKKTRNTNVADFLKCALINKHGNKNHLVCDEIGLPLDSHRKECRADIYNVDYDKVTIFEIKSSKQDFDTDFNKMKYYQYLKYCDYLYFVVQPELYEYINSKLFDEVYNIPNNNIGIYVVNKYGNLECKRRAKNNKVIDRSEKSINHIRDKINTQLRYRYYRQTSKILTDLQKELHDD